MGIGWIWCSTHVILLVFYLRLDLWLRTYAPRFASRPGDGASLNLFQEAVLPICYRTVTLRVAEERVYESF